MKRIWLLLFMSFIILTLSACTVKNTENDNKKVELVSDALKEEGIRTEESESDNEELLYEYTAKKWLEGKMYTLGINVPEGFYPRVNDMARMFGRVYFENLAGTQISVSPASDWDIERYENYIDNGIWESSWSDEAAEGDKEIQTPYGAVKIIIGNREGSDEPYAETVFFTYNDIDWIIEREWGPGTEDIEQLLNEMFTGKTELTEELFPNVDITIDDEEYSYILDSSDENIFGFNIDEYKYEELPSDSLSYIFAGDEGYIMVGYTNGYDATYHKDFLTTGNMPDGVIYLDMMGNGEILNMESKEEVNTKYGSTQIVYMTAHVEDAEVDWLGNYTAGDRVCEKCIFEVNGHEIKIIYKYPKSETYEYQGVLKGLLGEMF